MIAFYITNHGFGHIMRNIPVIAWLLEHTERKILLVTAAGQMEAAVRYLNRYTDIKRLDERLVTVEQEVDLGLVVKPGTLLVDRDALQEKIEKFTGRFPELIRDAELLFEKYQVDQVVSDIVPWVLTAAKNAGIPSILMASFTWVEQYEPHLPEELIDPFRKCYEDAGRVLMYSLVTKNTEQWFKCRTEVGLCARPVHEEQVRKIKARFADKPIVFVSIGMSNDGLKDGIDVSELPYYFVVTEGVHFRGDNVCALPRDIDNTQDYVSACDYCIAKAGWTTIAEALLSKKPLALLSRPDVVEDCMYIEELVREGEAVEVSVEELGDIQKVLHRLQNYSWKHRVYVNDYENIARIIEEG